MSVLYQLHITRTEWAVIYTCHVCNIFECIILFILCNGGQPYDNLQVGGLNVNRLHSPSLLD